MGTSGLLPWSLTLVAVGAFTVAAGSPPIENGHPTPVETVKGKDGAPMVLIPAGSFVMGSNDGLPNERPEHVVELDAYYIDQYEVTLALYRKFLESGKHESPPTWDDEAASTVGDRPAIGMKWPDAEAYCKWAGKRLPTEAEWEKAARGTTGRRYPWGNEWDLSLANSASYWAGRTIDFKSGADWEAFWVKGAGAQIAREKGLNGEVLTLPVGSFPAAASVYGLLDMAGNVAEWVQDWYDPNYYRSAPLTNPTGPERGAIKSMRGGSWLKPAISLRTTDRDWGTIDSRPSGTGFRCAQDAY
jgi:formylglycine-generating enzyme required for sulfatase activity